MKRLIPLALLALAGPAIARERSNGGASGRTPIGNPSALIAAESAFARLARDKGQWTAFAATAAEGAEMFVPRRTLAKGWLKGRANPTKPVQWQPHAAWISCDGSAGITFGGVHGTIGWFSTVWQRQKRGDYKWVLNQGGDLAVPLAAPEFLTGKVADCPVRSPRSLGKVGEAPPPRALPPPIPPFDALPGADNKDGRSADGTLAWRSTMLPGGNREWTVWMWRGDAMVVVLKRAGIAGRDPAQSAG
jgi:hypothetical protein